MSVLQVANLHFNSTGSERIELISGNVKVFTAGNFSINNNKVSGNVSSAAIVYVIDGGGSAITTGQKGYLEVPFNCTLDQWTILLDQSGSISIEIWKDTYANFPPTVADTINTNPYQVSSAIKAQGNQFTNTSTITAGDILAYNVVSATTTTRATISLRAVKT